MFIFLLLLEFQHLKITFLPNYLLTKVHNLEMHLKVS